MRGFGNTVRILMFHNQLNLSGHLSSVFEERDNGARVCLVTCS